MSTILTVELPAEILIPMRVFLSVSFSKVERNQEWAAREIQKAYDSRNLMPYFDYLRENGNNWRYKETCRDIKVKARNALRILEAIKDFERERWAAVRPPLTPPSLEDKVAALEAKVLRLQEQMTVEHAAFEAEIEACRFLMERANFNTASGVAA